MNSLNDLLQQPLVLRLGWTLIHFLWQGSAIALLFAAAQFALKRCSAQSRYIIACTSLAAAAVAPIITFLAHEDVGVGSLSPTGFVGGDAAATGALGTLSRITASHATAPSGGLVGMILPWLVLAWSIGVCSLSLRLVGGWLEVQRLRRCHTQSLGEPLLSKLEELKARLQVIRPVQLLKSALVEVPTVLGWLRPVILLPASTLTGLTPAQLESILSHELAHVRRNDYLVNILQRVVETVLFYHPAVWWMSKCIREERERCCDDLVIQVCGDRFGYARALASLEDLRSGTVRVVLAATDGSLGDRVRRLLGKSPDQPRLSWRRISLLTMLVIGPCLLALGVNVSSPQKLYASEVKLLVRYVATSDSRDQNAISTEVEVLTSRDVLRVVADRLDLPRRFASRRGFSATPDADSVCQHLAKSISVALAPNSTILRVTVVDESADTSTLIADALVDAYLRQRRSVSSKSAGVLRAELQKQQEELARLQERMDKVRSELPGADVADEAFQPGPDPEATKVFERARAEVEVKLANFESLLNQLTNQPRHELANAIPNLTYPDSRLTELLTQLGMTEISRVQLVQDFGEEHAKVLAVKAMIKELQAQVEHRVDGILTQIQMEVNRNREQLASLNHMASARQAEAKANEKYRPYFLAKRAVEQQQRICEAFELRIAQETVDSRATESSVQIVQRASPMGMVWRWF